MNDPAGPDGPNPTTTMLDTSIIPLGERSQRAILEHVVAVGDEAETTYLEVKSPLEMGSKVATAKIAKFLLGAANRRPHEAARHFHGYAVLVIGVQKGSAPGVRRGSEAHELEDGLRPYLGPQFPPFEFGRVGVDSGHEVLFVIAQPPRDGDTIFACHKEFQGKDRNDNLVNGAIYVRGASNTRPAHAGEVLALVERARGGGKPPIALEVEVLGQVHRTGRVGEVLQILRDFQEEQFDEEPEIADDVLAATSIRLASSIIGGTAHLTAEDRAKAFAVWQNNKVEHLANGREHLLGVGLSGAGIRVTSRDRFVTKPHLILTFHGCELFDHLDEEDGDLEKLAEPVLRTQLHGLSGIDYATLTAIRPGYPVTWRNRGEDAEVVIEVDAFRPNVPWTSEEDDFVINARDPQASSVRVTWTLTEDGSDSVTSGALQVPTEVLVDAGDLVARLFGRH